MFPLLAQRRFFKTLKYGYAGDTEPVPIFSVSAIIRRIWKNE